MVSSLNDRIKIDRDGKGLDIHLSIQYILNCGYDSAGSCHGGSAEGAFDFIQTSGLIPFESVQPYEACSRESTEDPYAPGTGCGAQRDYSCNALNTARTCSTFADSGGECVALNAFPNATVAEWGMVQGEELMLAEIYARGPIACGIDADGIDKYMGGIVSDDSPFGINHVVSVVGWGLDAATQKKFWIVRNSWGEAYGEMGFFRIERGSNTLGIEADCAWGIPGSYTTSNFPCWEDGGNCQVKAEYKAGPNHVAGAVARKMGRKAI